jgi:hypothetical protein
MHEDAPLVEGGSRPSLEGGDAHISSNMKSIYDFPYLCYTFLCWPEQTLEEA